MERIIDFLKELKENNNRDWFKDNKSRYLEMKAIFDQFIEDQILRISTMDSALQGASAKNSVYRIYRDVRFAEPDS